MNGRFNIKHFIDLIIMEILLPNGFITIIDDEDFDAVKNYNWRLKKNHDIYYAYAQIEKKRVLMHRFLMNVNDTEILIDHIDNNGLNNRKKNLRLCNQTQNKANRKGANKNSISKYKGVGLKRVKLKSGKQTNKSYWIAYVGGHYIGTFKNEIDAAKAYDKKAIELFGKFANLNFKTMEKNCIICGQLVTVPTESEIVTCESPNCIHTVETCVGFHQTIYTGPNDATSK